MRILINTVCFYPNVGGLETMNMLLCTELSKRGHDVVVLAPDYSGITYDDSKLPFAIYRNASPMTIFREYLKCDVFFHRQISLKAVWPVLLWPFKKWVSSYHMCEFDQFENTTFLGRLKYLASRFPQNIAVSNTVAKCLNLPNVQVVHNAYDDKLFVDQDARERTGFIFVGRLVSVKGIRLALEAFEMFYKQAPQNKHATFTIVGNGEEREFCEEYVAKHNLKNVVTFKGTLRGQELVNEINKHYCQIIPSIYREAFGIVALESMATGCITLVSDGDGLAEALGDGGFIFKKGQCQDLLTQMVRIANLSAHETFEIKKMAKERCSELTPEKVAERYEVILKS